MNQINTELLEALKAALQWIEGYPNSGRPSVEHQLRNAIAKAEQAERVEPAYPDEWAKFLHYPDCWDTAAYPTLKDAIHEALAWSECSVCKPAAAVSEPVAEVVACNVYQSPSGKYAATVESTERLSVGAELFIHPPAAAVSEPLTDDQISYYAEQEMDLYSFARAIEAAIRSK
jgi:hypothetical protein